MMATSTSRSTTRGGEPRAVALGATVAESSRRTTSGVHLDPAGHPHGLWLNR